MIRDEIAHDVLVLHSEVLAEGQIWDMRRDRLQFGDGELQREYLDHTGAVAVLAIDTDDAGVDRVLLMQQYRHPIRHRDWEIPAGLMDVPGEQGLAAAQRELAEEADLEANEWAILIDMFLSPGCSSEAMRIFLARGLRPAEHDYVRSEEEVELQPVWVPLDDAVEAVLAGRVQNAVTAGAVLAAAASRARGWETLRDPHEPWHAREAVSGKRSR